MADRVAVIGGFSGNVDPAVAGTGTPNQHQVPGRDHFPFPVQHEIDPLDADDDWNNLPLTLAQACEIFYRVKKWRVRATCESDAQPDFDRYADFEVGASYEVSEDDPPVETQTSPSYTRESDLIGNPVHTPLSRRLSSGTGTAWQILSIIPFNSFFYFDPFDESFRPSVVVGVDLMCRSINPGYGSSSGAFSIILGSGTITHPTGTWNISGIVGTFTTSIEAIEYWPYATKAGLPVYDTSDGSVLNDPLS